MHQNQRIEINYTIIGSKYLRGVEVKEIERCIGTDLNAWIIINEITVL